VTATPSAQAAEFIESVLRLQPSLAVFDCDGTLWAGDAGERFFDWELKRGLVSRETALSIRARYADYKTAKVSEDDMCGEMVTLHRGLTEPEVQKAAKQFFEENFAAQIFPELRELVNRLQVAGCDVWAVSSTNAWVIQTAMTHFGIPANKVLAAAVEVENGMITERLIRVPSGEGKPRAIRDVIRRDPDVAFGNSRWDAAMLKISKHAFAVNPNPDLEEMARAQGWTVYFPDSVRRPESKAI
jgi:HAD superfamily phosphoserine phosphatase-like hydrolase